MQAARQTMGRLPRLPNCLLLNIRSGAYLNSDISAQVSQACTIFSWHARACARVCCHMAPCTVVKLPASKDCSVLPARTVQSCQQGLYSPASICVPEGAVQSRTYLSAGAVQSLLHVPRTVPGARFRFCRCHCSLLPEEASSLLLNGLGHKLGHRTSWPV